MVCFIRARFYFDPNTITMANNTVYYLFYNDTGTSTVVLQVAMSNDSTTFASSSCVNITDATHIIELDRLEGFDCRKCQQRQGRLVD